MALGHETKASAASAVAIGGSSVADQAATASGAGAVALGGASGAGTVGASAAGAGAVAIGGDQGGSNTANGANASAVGAVSIGSGSFVSAPFGVAIGGAPTFNNGASVNTGGLAAVAIGGAYGTSTAGTSAIGASAVAIGGASGTGTIGANANSNGAIAIGGDDGATTSGASALAAGSIAIGYGATSNATSGTLSVAIGATATCPTGNSVAIGAGCHAYTDYSVVIGTTSSGGTSGGTDTNCIVIGQDCTATGANAIAINGSVDGFASTAIGWNTYVSAENAMCLGSGQSDTNYTNSIHNSCLIGFVGSICAYFQQYKSPVFSLTQSGYTLIGGSSTPVTLIASDLAGGSIIFTSSSSSHATGVLTMPTYAELSALPQVLPIGSGYAFVTTMVVDYQCTLTLNTTPITTPNGSDLYIYPNAASNVFTMDAGVQVSLWIAQTGVIWQIVANGTSSGS